MTDLCSRRRHSLSTKAVSYTNILEKVVQNKGSQCLCSQDIQKCETHENCLPMMTINILESLCVNCHSYRPPDNPSNAQMIKYVGSKVRMEKILA